MILEKYEKQPAERKDYDINYSEWLAPMADTLATVTATVVCLSNAADASLTCSSVEHTTTAAKFWMTGGTHAGKYKLTATATTSAGRIDESELIFTVKDY